MPIDKIVVTIGAILSIIFVLWFFFGGLPARRQGKKEMKGMKGMEGMEGMNHQM